MEKELWIKYVDILNRQTDCLENNEKFILTSEEEIVINQLQELNDLSKDELLKKIKEASKEDRQEIVEQFFQEKGISKEENLSEEEEIAKVFGVSVEKINHKYLSNGKEIFSFYNPILQRQILLENEDKGVSLKERLEELQQENIEFQTSNEEENSQNILMNERNTKDLELSMYTPYEIINHPNLLGGISQSNLALVEYLLKNYEQLHIQSINLDNLIYLDEKNEIYEVSMNDNKEVIVNTPEDEMTSSNSISKKDDISQMLDEREKEDMLFPPYEEENKNDSEISKMFEEEEKTAEINSLLLDQTYQPKEKVYVLSDDGHVNKPLFIGVVSFLIIVAIVCILMIIK